MEVVAFDRGEIHAGAAFMHSAMNCLAAPEIADGLAQKKWLFASTSPAFKGR